ncbi:MAG: hypothetical protein QXK37_02095 [Candidatus Woesearchaeota archaeon]
MNQLEQNIVESFRLVKNDVLALQKSLAEIAQNQQRMFELLNDTREKEASLYQRLLQIKERKEQQLFVASKTGKSLHMDKCPFAKNIKPSSRIVFGTKVRGLNAGLKLCECLKSV